MTVLFAFIGIPVFLISIFTVGFKAAWKRLWAIVITGFCIDLFIVAVAVCVTLALTY